MNDYYITRRDGTIIAMDATTDLSEKFVARPTAHPVVNGKTVTDTIIQDLPRFELRGFISGVAQPDRRNRLFIGEVTEQIIETITAGEIVKLQSADREYSVCVITDVDFKKSSREGNESWEVRIALSKILVTEAITNFIEDPNTLTPEAQAIRDKLIEANKPYDTTTKNIPEEKADPENVLERLKNTTVEDRLKKQFGI